MTENSEHQSRIFDAVLDSFLTAKDQVVDVQRLSPAKWECAFSITQIFSWGLLLEKCNNVPVLTILK